MKLLLPDQRVIEVPLLQYVWIPVVLLAIAGFATSAHQIQEQEQGLVLRFGKHIDTIEPGLRFVMPFGIDQVIVRNTRQVQSEEFGYRRQAAPNAPAADVVRAEGRMLTGDLNIVLAEWDVQYTIPDPIAFTFNVREPEATLRDIAMSVMREIMGDRASIPILTVGRAELQSRARTLIQENVDEFDMGIQVREVNLSSVSPPQQVLPAFSDLNKAEQDANRFFEEARREYEQRVPRARGEADRIVKQAEAFREERVNEAQGQANRFLSILEAYRQSPAATRRRLYLEVLERRFPNLDEIVVVDDELPSLLPMLDLGGNRTDNRNPNDAN